MAAVLGKENINDSTDISVTVEAIRTTIVRKLGLGHSLIYDRWILDCFKIVWENKYEKELAL